MAEYNARRQLRRPHDLRRRRSRDPARVRQVLRRRTDRAGRQRQAPAARRRRDRLRQRRRWHLVVDVEHVLVRVPVTLGTSRRSTAPCSAPSAVSPATPGSRSTSPAGSRATAPTAIGVHLDEQDGADFDSREAGATAPQLVITTGTAPPSGDPVLVGCGRHRQLDPSGDTTTAALLDTIPGDGLHRGRQRLPGRHGGGVQHLLRADLGPAQGPHQPGHRATTTTTRPAPPATTTTSAPWPVRRGRGYYSYDLGNWHVVSLNSEISMAAGSPQETWLRNDLAASTKPCTFAYWHKPLFTSGSNHAPHRHPAAVPGALRLQRRGGRRPATTTTTSASRR